MKETTISRRQFLKMAAMVSGTVALTPLINACKGGTATMDDWKNPADASKLKGTTVEYMTYGMPDDWASYGDVLQAFAKKYEFTLNHTDTDMSSLEEITKFDAEKNNPAAISADIGLMYGPVAEKKGVVPPFLPPNAAKLPVGLKAATGGWVATFVGIPSFVVNTDAVQNVPLTWKDLLKPEYTGKIGTINAAGGGGTDMNTFFAWCYDNGGSVTKLDAGVEFAKAMLKQYSAAGASDPTLEKGEVPIWIRYDFNCIKSADKLKQKGINAKVVIPPGTIYGPLGLMINKYNLAKMDVAKLFLDFVLTDEAQTIFAKFGARPIRYTLGDLTLPADAKGNWLPDADYASTIQVTEWGAVDAQQVSEFFQKNVLGG